jgi:molybdopterin synthase catalytic subunit
MVSISTLPIDVGSILKEVSTPESGGIDVFVGTVRNHSRGKHVIRLEYSAYVPMAEKLMAEIEEDIHRRWPVHHVALIHRIGSLEIGDIAVVTAVSSAHRHVAFEACRYAIERVKAVVPVWKKEFAEDGEVWVEGLKEEMRKPEEARS